MPTPRFIEDIKAKLLNPALTSHFEVEIPIPKGLQGDNGRQYLKSNGLSQFDNIKQGDLNLLCSETVLPGSNIGTMDITGDYHGVTQRHANRRIYDDRIDLTFYVDALNYLPIRYFETWIKYCVGESIVEKNERPGSQSPNYFYRLNYPDLYICPQGLKVIKFERDYKSFLEYEFINAFPISIASMPISYDASSLLKCTVSFSYIRYILSPRGTDPGHPDAETNENAKTIGDPSNPVNQSAFNSVQFDPNAYTKTNLTFNYGNFTTTGGVDYAATFSSGNTIDTQTAFNSGVSLF